MSCTLQSLYGFLLAIYEGLLTRWIHTDSERRFQCQVGRHQEPKRRDSGLDYPTWAISQPASGPQYQKRPRISSRAHRCLVVSCRLWLVWSRVGSLFIFLCVFLTASRIKEKLRSGELAVPGDQWPVFLYRDNLYDPNNPWNGLFRSSILVSVCLPRFDL